MLELLVRLLNRLRPQEGWTAFLLVLAALLCLPASLLEANEDLRPEGLLIMTLLAVIVGLRFARARISARGATILGGLLGAVLTVVVVGRLLPPLSLAWTEISHTVQWLGQRQGEVAAELPPPLASTGVFVWQQINNLGLRLWWWGQTINTGAPAQDPIIFLLLITFLNWTFGLVATWQIYRRRAPLVGLLPSGVALAIVAFFAAALTVFYLITYLFCTLWLIAICHLWSRRDHWEQTATDYPGDLGMELALALGPGLVLILGLATIFPVIHPHQVREAFWRLMDGPWANVEQVAEQLFGPIESGYYGGGGAAGIGSLPRSHLLGGAPELAETIVFYITTSDPPPPLPDPAEPEQIEPELPRRYWRDMTYDTYTGLGWDNGPLESRASPPDQPLGLALPPGFELVQQFELFAPPDNQIYVANAPLRIDHPVETWWRAPGDLAKVSGDAKRYTAISRPPEPTIADLRNAIDMTPPDLVDRYLALPDTVPQRVLDLAEQVVQETETRYDQARAIELFLRTYTYTLDLPPPPPDQDVVDYFLFDLQEGYCDYYASSMVVMARAVGIPARLASGYAQGTYDHDMQRWVVTEKDGHSWVEVHFDGIGWVEFEPTAGQPVLNRSGGDPSDIMIPPKPPRTGEEKALPWGLVVVGGILVALVAVVISIWFFGKHQEMMGADLIRDRYARLVRWGARLEAPLHDGQTPNEYSTTLIENLHSRGRNTRWPQVRQASTEAPVEVEQLTNAFVRAQYSPQPLTEREGWRAHNLWLRLRRYLWWLWFAAGFRKGKR